MQEFKIRLTRTFSHPQAGHQTETFVETDLAVEFFQKAVEEGYAAYDVATKQVIPAEKYTPQKHPNIVMFPVVAGG